MDARLLGLFQTAFQTPTVHLNLDGVGLESADGVDAIARVLTALAARPQPPSVAALDVSNNLLGERSLAALMRLLVAPAVANHVETLRLRCLALPRATDLSKLLVSGFCV